MQYSRGAVGLLVESLVVLDVEHGGAYGALEARFVPDLKIMCEQNEMGD